MTEFKRCPACAADRDNPLCPECEEGFAAWRQGLRHEVTTDELNATDEGRAKDGRIRQNVSNRDTVAKWLRKELGRGPLSGLFWREGELVFTPRVGEEGYIPPKRRDGRDDHDGPAQVRVMTTLDLKTAAEIRYSFGVGKQKEIKDDEGNVTRTRKIWEPKMLPTECASNAHTAAQLLDDVPNLRVLRGVTHTPILRPDGSILDRPGYDDATGLLYLPEAGLTIPKINTDPTPGEIKDAVALIETIIGEFPFVEDFHRANWIGALFTPILRATLPPPYPAFVFDAPSAGSGKGFLAWVLRTVHGGVFRSGFPDSEAEFEKSTLGLLLDTTAPVVTFDNVRGKIKSPKFEGLLTSAIFSGRVLGKTGEHAAPNDRLWTITANNAEIGGDLARRCYWVTVDPKMPRPHERTGFKIDLKTWVPERRGEIIAALLTIVRGWLAAGRQTASRKRGDDYAMWDAAMEGLISWAGFECGQFGKPDARHLESSDDQEWEELLHEIARVMGFDRPFKLGELVEKIATPESPFTDGDGDRIDPSKLPGDLADKWDRGFGKNGFSKSLGMWLKYRAGRYAGDITIRILPDPKNGNRYRVERYVTER